LGLASDTTSSRSGGAAEYEVWPRLFILSHLRLTRNNSVGNVCCRLREDFVGENIEEWAPSTLPFPFRLLKYDLPIESVRTGLVEDRQRNIPFNDPVIKFLHRAILLSCMVALQIGL
jgi:hypothetical protein